MLHAHKDRTDHIDLIACLNEFVSGSEHSVNLFGRFLNWLLHQVVLPLFSMSWSLTFYAMTLTSSDNTCNDLMICSDGMYTCSPYHFLRASYGPGSHFLILSHRQSFFIAHS